ncbi:MAG: DUF2085 domain-containing protein [Chloroflexi bacterium]|nr:MAG: DUF2085 domain-containing protein [Chloroflexota bacterium]
METVNSTQSLRRASLKGLVFIAAGLLLLGWLLNTPAGILGKADAVGYAVCHRIDVRSFHIGDRALPLCARCSGMFLGAALGLAFQSIFFPRRTGTPPWYILVILALFVAAFAVDGLNSYLHLFENAPNVYEPQNWSRLVTGTGMGITISVGMYLAFNQTVWKGWDQRPAIHGWVPLAGLIFLAGIMNLLVLSENSFVLYPLALISAGSVLVLLTMIYTMVLIMLFRRENTYERFQSVLFPLLGGFIIALLQVAATDYLRFLLTGTWGGFPIG